MSTPNSTGPERFGLRRALFASLVLATAAGALAAFGWLVGRDGMDVLDWLMLVFFGLTLPWVAIGFWCAVIGLLILHLKRDPVAYVTPMIRDGDGDRPLEGRTALLLAIHDEDPDAVFRHLRATVECLDRAGVGEHFDIHVLSDTRHERIAAEERRLFDAWQGTEARQGRLHYRRRHHNTDHKTGNIWEWLDRAGAAYDYFVTLDADSLMSGDLLARLVRIMDRNPDLGILQTLITGLPSSSAFSRPASTMASARRRSSRPSYSARPVITPAMPAASSASNACRSPSPATPPEAITGSPLVRASAAVAATFTPSSVPSRSTSV